LSQSGVKKFPSRRDDSLGNVCGGKGGSSVHLEAGGEKRLIDKERRGLLGGGGEPEKRKAMQKKKAFPAGRGRIDERKKVCPLPVDWGN